MHASLTFPLSDHSLPGNILLTDALGIARYANEGIAERTGFSVAEIIDSKPGQLWGGQMPRSFYDRMWQSLRTDSVPFVGRVTNRTKQGERYEELLAVTPLMRSDGAVAYLALRPAHLGEQDRFLEEWRGVFTSRATSAAKALPWLQRWFPESGATDAEPGATLADWIETQWVKPIRARFQRRSEDRVLVERAQRDPNQFRQLYDKYHMTVQKYFVRHLPGQDDQISDLTQDTFVRAFERLDGYETRNAAYGTYLLRIAHSVLLNTYRHQAMLELSPDYSVPETVRPAEMDWIWETPELNPREQVVLSAYYREGFSVREISRGLGISENATKLLMSRARKKIRPLLGSV
ncbi:MAG: sigma-70 family RNA polymerase sigma factor [Candidatus Moraniibacteriota bacterium]